MVAAAWLSCAMVLSAAGALEEGSVLDYQGSFVAVKGDPVASRKTFSLQLLAAQKMPEGMSVAWTLEEKGRGGWGWPDRLGVVELDQQWQPRAAGGPALLYEREEGRSVVGLFLPILPLPAQPLEKGVAWEWNKLTYTVVDAGLRLNRNCWKVEARNAYGVRRTVWVDQTQPVIVTLRERVFIGQGEEHDLTLELKSQNKLSTDQLAATNGGIETIQKLLGKLGREPQMLEAAWNDEQLALLKSSAASLEPLGQIEFLASLVTAVVADIKTQKGRAGALAAFRDKLIGTSLGEIKLEAVAGPAITGAEFKDKVTVLHFWEYRDSPLEEPYGQTGYLDFLFRKQKEQPVAVFGITVDENATTQTGRRKAALAANKMKNFMNLSYPLLIDDGSLLKRVGDPRVAGAKLPLFIVLDKHGKVVEYHAGHYEVQRDRGLEELNQIISKAAGSRE